MYTFKHKVRYYETDKMGFVHHSNYIRWFEDARGEFFESVGAPYEKTEERGIISPVLSITCNYKKSCYYAEVVLIELVLEKFDNVKFKVSYKVFGEKSGELKATGESEHCFLNKEGRVVSLKKEWPEKFQLLHSIAENEHKE